MASPYELIPRPPLEPEDIKLVAEAHTRAVQRAGIPVAAAEAEELAALAIRLFQVGMTDTDVLVQSLLWSHERLLSRRSRPRLVPRLFPKF
jgi:hypothetical protein